MEATVTIYSAPTCPYCRAAKEFFKEKGLAFVDRDVVNDNAAYEEMKEVSGGARSVPVIVVGDQILLGFERGRVEQALASA